MNSVLRLRVAMGLATLLAAPLSSCSNLAAPDSEPGIAPAETRHVAGPMATRFVVVQLHFENAAPWPIVVNLVSSGRSFTINPGTSVDVNELDSSRIKATYLAYSVSTTLPTHYVSGATLSAGARFVRVSPGIFQVIPL